MNIYECAPQKNMRKLSGLVMIFICVATALFLISSIFQDMPYRWAVQLLGFGCLAAVVYIAARYVSKALVYRIVENEGERFLTVTEVTNGGRSQITVCRIGIESIEAVYSLDKKSDTDKLQLDRISAESKKGRKRFSYHPDVFPRTICVILANEGGEALDIRIAVDGTLVEYLKKEIDRA